MISRKRLAYFSVALLLASLITSAHADVKLASIFGDSMVLQRELPVPVWGWAEAGEEVTVTLGEQTRKATADKDGRWQVKLDALKAKAEGQTLKVTGKNSIELKDVLIGEVWICSGQSNMEWSLNAVLNANEEVAAANHPQIRLFNVPGHTTSPVANDTCPGAWQVCAPNTAAGFSAVGYFFGRRLQAELKVPIGLVGSNWGGTLIEPWTSPAGFQSVPELKAIADQVAAYTAETQVGGGSPSAIYNAMIHPLAPFAMRGAIWYQGESNGGEGESYYHKTQALVNGWRQLFNPDLAFYWVQLANFQNPNESAEGGDGWARIREAQRKSLNIKHTGMAVIIDIGEAGDIHPRNKQDVGSRLAVWALHQTYGMKDIVPSGPLYKGQKVEGNSIRLSFDNVGSGLVVGKKEGLAPLLIVKDGKLERFAIAGADKKWHLAEATIDGSDVIVKSPDVKSPVAVRYAYSMNPTGANLYNIEGIPASPFRTDDW
jgi:sialate O-acetylesterase